MGSFRMFLFYIITMIGSNLFASMLSPYASFGPEPFMIAMFSGLIGCIIVFWDHLGENFGRKACFLVLIVIIMAIALAYIFSQQNMYASLFLLTKIKYPDVQGALGCFLFGMFTTFLILPSREYGFLSGPSTQRALTYVGMIGLALLFLLSILGFAFKDFSKV